MLHRCSTFVLCLVRRFHSRVVDVCAALFCLKIHVGSFWDAVLIVVVVLFLL